MIDVLRPDAPPAGQGETGGGVSAPRLAGNAPRNRGRSPRLAVAIAIFVPGDAYADRAPGIPADLEDHDRDQQTDDRVANLPAESHEGRARDDAQGDETVHAGMLSVGNEGGTAHALARVQTHTCSQFVAQEADESGSGKRPQMRKLLGMD